MWADGQLDRARFVDSGLRHARGWSHLCTPGITLCESGDGKVLLATTGRVRVKVDASRGAIQIGDLLVTSDVPGVAMKSEPVEFAGRKMHMPGTIIGKELEPLAKGKGEMLVLLSLQ